MRKIANILDIFPEPDRSELTARLIRYGEKLLSDEGPRAFDMPRSAALAHEAGHAIVFAHDGIEVECVAIWHGTHPMTGIPAWCGGTFERKRRWKLGPQSPLDDVLKRAGFMIAGEAGEAVLDPDGYRRGSSLDEVVGSQALVAAYAPPAAAEARGGETLWRKVRARSAAIIYYNKAVARDLIERLDRTQTVRGRALKEILARVQLLRPDPAVGT
jgi:hypothetical protein